MPRKNDYDDLYGLDMYDMGQWLTPSMVQDSVIAAAAGGGAILLASWVSPMLPVPENWQGTPNAHRLRAAVATLGGMIVGRLMWDWNRDAAMAVIGGVSGLGIAQLVDSFFKPELVGNPLGALPQDVELSEEDEALMGAYDYDQAQALASLGTTGVTSAPSAFADPTVTPEALMGFGGTVVQGETLGYNPYMA
jgi:hypothetical protein